MSSDVCGLRGRGGISFRFSRGAGHCSRLSSLFASPIRIWPAWPWGWGCGGLAQGLFRPILGLGLGVLVCARLDQPLRYLGDLARLDRSLLPARGEGATGSGRRARAASSCPPPGRWRRICPSRLRRPRCRGCHPAPGRPAPGRGRRSGRLPVWVRPRRRAGRRCGSRQPTGRRSCRRSSASNRPQ